MDDVRAEGVGMDDLTMTRLCAEAMGYEVVGFKTKNGGIMVRHTHHMIWNPLDDDEQAMALVKKFHLIVGFSDGWSAQKRDEDGDAVLRCGSFHQPDLNRAIVECVAKMRATDASIRRGKGSVPEQNKEDAV